MGKIIKVHSDDDDEVYINANNIDVFVRFNRRDFTSIYTSSSQYIRVKETPEEIMKLINESKISEEILKLLDGKGYSPKEFFDYSAKLGYSPEETLAGILNTIENMR